MVIKRTSHAVFDPKYHLVWEPKYRKWILKGGIKRFVQECFEKAAFHNGFEIEAMEIADDHVHIFLGLP